MQFGMWKVLDGRSLNNRNIEMWECECSCGTVRYVNSKNLLRGVSKGCGCNKQELTGNRFRKHGHSSSNEYKIWAGVVQRCTYEKHIGYHRYGAKGITVCDEWKTFENFLRDMGKRPTKHHSIERIENSKGYSKDNCKWATQHEQARNKEQNIYIEYEGSTVLLVDLAIEHKVDYHMVYRRTQLLGWSVEDALNTPILKKGYHKRNTKAVYRD